MDKTLVSPWGRLASALLVGYVLFLAMAGPLTVPGFAERQPYHGHVYLDQQAAGTSHDHSYEGGSGDSGIVFLPTNAYDTTVSIIILSMAFLAALVIPAVRLMAARLSSFEQLALRAWAPLPETPPPRISV